MSETVTILGTGPAGLTAAIYSARAGMKPVVVEGEQPGGQLMITSDVENYPGFVQPISGPELMDSMRKQAERFGTRFVRGKVIGADLSKRPFVLKLDDGSEIRTQAMIVAVGAFARWLGLPSEKRLMGKGVSACATCDGFFFRNQDVVVVGGGDTAIEEATFLTRFAKTVTIIHRRDHLRASKIMQHKAHTNSKIKFLWDSVIEDILGEKEVTGIRVRNVKDGTVQDLPVHGVFIAIGHEPNTRIFNGQLECDAEGYVVVETGSTRTSVPGVFAAGDAADRVYRQAITAAATGCKAAIDVERFLQLGIGA